MPRDESFFTLALIGNFAVQFCGVAFDCFDAFLRFGSQYLFGLSMLVVPTWNIAAPESICRECTCLLGDLVPVSAMSQFGEPCGA
jgi:hypothetical protein